MFSIFVAMWFAKRICTNFVRFLTKYLVALEFIPRAEMKYSAGKRFFQGQVAPMIHSQAMQALAVNKKAELINAFHFAFVASSPGNMLNNTYRLHF